MEEEKKLAEESLGSTFVRGEYICQAAVHLSEGEYIWQRGSTFVRGGVHLSDSSAFARGGVHLSEGEYICERRSTLVRGVRHLSEGK